MLEALPVCKADKGRYDFPVITLRGERGERTVRTAVILTLPNFRIAYFSPMPQQFNFPCSVNNEWRKKQWPWYPCRLLPVSLWLSRAAHKRMGCSTHMEIHLFLSSQLTNQPLFSLFTGHKNILWCKLIHIKHQQTKLIITLQNGSGTPSQTTRRWVFYMNVHITNL